MKVLYINIIVKEASLIELYLIHGSPESEYEEEIKECKFYIDRMFPKEQVEEKYKGVIDYLLKRINDDEPTIASIMKAHRDAHCRGETNGSLVYQQYGKGEKKDPIPGWKLERIIQQKQRDLTPEEEANH